MCSPELAETANVLARYIIEVLENESCPDNVNSEERELLPWVSGLIGTWLSQALPEVEMTLCVGKGRRAAPGVRVLGTDFWPDIAFSHRPTGQLLIAVELKLVKRGTSGDYPDAIRAVLGQCVLYRARYLAAVGFILAYTGERGQEYHQFDESLSQFLKDANIQLVIRP